MMMLHEWLLRRWLLLFGGGAFAIACSVLAWRVAAIHPSFSSELYVALGSVLIVASSISLIFIVTASAQARTARVPLILGPVVGSAAAGLGSIALVAWPNSWTSLLLFAVAIVSFPMAGLLAIFLRASGRLGPRPAQAPVRGQRDESRLRRF
jgi:hypothetical protein